MEDVERPPWPAKLRVTCSDCQRDTIIPVDPLISIMEIGVIVYEWRCPECSAGDPKPKPAK